MLISKQRKGGYPLKYYMLKLGNHRQTVLKLPKFILLKDPSRPVQGRKNFHELSDVETPVADSGNP